MSEPENHSFRRVDSPESLEQLLERGQLLMMTLTHEAQAARLEAQRAELRFALEDARNGLPNQLMKIISSLDSKSARAEPTQPNLFTRSSIFNASVRADESSTNTEIDRTSGSSSSGSSADPTFDPWSQLRKHAQARLVQRNCGTQARTSLSEKPATKHLRFDPPHHDEKQSSTLIAQPHVRPKPSQVPAGRVQKVQPAQPPSDQLATATPASMPAQRNTSRPTSRSSARTPESSNLDRHNAVLARKKNFVLDSGTERTASSPNVAKKLGGGLGFSIVFHGIIVVCLAIYHLHAPEIDAGLAFEASPIEHISEPLEISQPTEIAEPQLEPDQPIEPIPATPAEIQQSLTDLRELSIEKVLQTPQKSTASMLTDSASASQSAIQAVAGAGASFFGVATGGNNFCYVVDSSGSMRGHAWEAAKNELLRSLASLKPQQRFYVIFFGKEFEAIPEPGSREPSRHALYATQENLEHARRWIELIKISSGTPPNDAIEFAISKDPDAIYLLTDGVTRVDVCAFLNKVNRVDDLFDGQRVKIPIHAIAFFSLEGQDLLRRIAAENRGQFIYVPNPRKK